MASWLRVRGEATRPALELLPGSEISRVDVGDLALHVTRTGSGFPLIMLHGFTGSAAQWGCVVPRLARAHEVIAPDLIGHGRSAAPRTVRRYRFSRAVADLRVLLDRLGIARAAWLGYSMGGRLALAFAVAQPERVDRLILESASPGLIGAGARRARRAADAALAARLEAEGTEPFVDAWLAQPLFASQARVGARRRAAARGARLVHTPHGLANCLRGMGAGAQPSFWHRLDELDIPTLLITGALDVKFRTIAQAMAQRLPRAEVAIIPAAGHAAHFERPAAFTTRVLDFLHGTHRQPTTDDR